MDILALDFDGVICDSAAEAAVAGWKAAGGIWPDRFIGDIPDEIAENFQQVRPVMETGFESILLVRLLQDGYAVSEILKNSTALYSSLMRDECINPDELTLVYGQTRDTWMAGDLNGWLDMHEFYEGTVEALNRSQVPKYIITTKQMRFARSLCRHVALRIPAENIFGLESGKKQHVLGALSRRHPNACFHFLEDRLPTLTRMIHGFDFNVRLYFARWGYHTPDQWEQAQNISEIKVLSQDQFPDFVKRPSHYVQLWGRRPQIKRPHH
jgi:phosphoglycolate phosphatase-like HAD superfamily hydrolase